MHMRVIKVILGGAKHVCGRKECILHLILGKGCFLGYCNQEKLGALSDTCHEVESLSKRAFKLTLEAFHGVDEGECLNREPVILVLDFDVQMLPRESLPIVRIREVYRMIDCLCDSGLQFFPAQGIQKLQNCAATLLMGCSSGSLSLNGSYTPQGAPLCYLLAGSPVIVANLWEVTDKDIDRFSKAIFDCCLEERLTDSLGCVQCNLVTGKFNSMKITGTKGNAKKKTSRKTVLENLDKSL